MIERPRARTREKAPHLRSPLDGIGTTVEARRSESDGQGVCEACPPPLPTILTSLTRAVFRQGDGAAPEPSPEPVFGARHRDRVRPRFPVQDGVERRVVDLSARRRGTDRTVLDCGPQVDNVSPHSLVNRVKHGSQWPVVTDLVRPVPPVSSHTPKVPSAPIVPSDRGRNVGAHPYGDRNYELLGVGAMDEVLAYVPARMDPREWGAIAGYVRDVTLTALERYEGRYNAQDMIGAVAGLTRWATQVACLPMEVEVVFHRDTIAEYIARAELSVSSRATIRSRLLRVAEAVLPAEERVTRLQPLRADDPVRPYSEFEQRRLRSWAEGQTTPTRRMECRAILSLGFGAGLASSDIIALHARDILTDDLGVLIRVPGNRARDVPVLAAWEQGIVDLQAARAGDDWLLGARRTSGGKNWLNNTIAASSPEGTLWPVPARMRNTWLLHHMTVGTPLGPLAAAAGLETFRTIEKLLCFVPEPTVDEVRRSMRRSLRAVI